MVMTGIDLGDDDEYSEENENIDRRILVERSLAAVMMYHSGMLADFGFDQDFIDSRMEVSRQAYADAGVHEPHLIGAASLRTQLGNPEDPRPMILDRRIFENHFHMPSTLSAGDVGPFTYIWPTGTEIVFDTYQQFLDAYTRTAMVVSELPSILMEVINPMFRGCLPYSNPAWELQMSMVTFIPPEVKLSGTPHIMSISRLLSTSRFDGRLVSIQGQTMEVGEVLQRPIRASWRCIVNNCNHDNIVMCDPFEEKEVKPDSCTVCEAGTSSNDRKAKFVINAAPKSTFTTSQRAIIQVIETATTNPPQILVETRGSDVNMLEPGEGVTLTGIYRNISVEGTKGTVERTPILHVTEITATSRQTSVIVTQEEREVLNQTFTPLSFRQKVDRLVSMFAPGIHGYDLQKGGLILQSVGGNLTIGGQPADKRHWIHIFMIGDPGVAKSELMKHALRNHPSSKRASGARASIPGLVGGASTSKGLGGKRGMKPGMMALVPYGGIVAIDELHAMEAGGRKDTIKMLNDALETGQVTAAMQFSGTVKTEVPVLIAANPIKGNNSRLDLTPSAEPLIDQIGLDGALMSRADAIFLFPDTVDVERDALVANAMMASRLGNVENGPASSIEDALPKYLQMCREQDEVVYSQQISEFISKKYQRLRQIAVGENRVTARWLASLMRLSEACARLDMSTTLGEEHVNYALEILEESLTTKEPAITTEGSSGLMAHQSMVYDLVRDLFFTHFSLLDYDQTWTGFDEAILYIKQNWTNEEYECPNDKDIKKVLIYWKDQGSIKVSGKRLRDNRPQF